MALETVVFQQDPFNYSHKDCTNFYNLENFHDFDHFGFDHGYNWNSPNSSKAQPYHNNNNSSANKFTSSSIAQSYSTNTNTSADRFTSSSIAQSYNTNHNTSADRFTSSSIAQSYNNNNNSSPEACTGLFPMEYFHEESTMVSGRRKRRRTKCAKNKEEIENQRMTHIAVERNRRRQMNDYLAILRSLMPPSYAQRGDQASIVGGAINFVKELEQLLQFLEGHKQVTTKNQQHSQCNPFSDFFTFPHHANVKVLSRRRPKQLLKIVNWLQAMCLTILHLSVTTADHMVLYTFSVKVEDNCQLNTVSEIASAVHEMVAMIKEEAMSC
ncbi:Transcription factor bHLH96 [Capsicum annuum]|uniref:Transcription factor bHLH96 n=1 Tax=Capsicum annuum TaxID=4072 RepID=A0A2G2Y5X0_CAPAN|nr:Transcription factor bHLH96 [Capsicum annuum]